MIRWKNWLAGLLVGVALNGVLAESVMAQAEAEEAPAKPVRVAEDNPLLTEPRSPETLFDAVVLMTDLARPNLAHAYLQKLLEGKPNEAMLLKLRDKHGPAMFLKLSNDVRLQPESITLLEQMNAAFRKGALDPKRVDALIAGLSKSAAEREVSILQLRNAGQFGAARLVTVLNSSKDPGQRKLLLYTLTRLNREVVPVLLGAMNAPNPDLRASLIEALGWLDDPQAIMPLWFSAFDESESAGVTLSARQALARLKFGDVNRTADVSAFGAVAALSKSARQHLRGDQTWPLNDEGKVEWWEWDQASGGVTMSFITAETASSRMAVRQAREAFELSPQRIDLNGLYWSARMALELYEAGRGAEVASGPGSNFHLGLELGPDVMQVALIEANQAEQAQVAVVALRVLSQIGSPHLLNSRDGRPAPVVAAMNHPDPRVQFAAVSTILTWEPTTSFRGISRVIEVLSRTISDAGKARGVAIDANDQRATSMSAALHEMGFEPDRAPTGQEGFKIAAERGDVGLLLIEANVARWELSQTVANLRGDARTAFIPIVIYGDERIRDGVERLAAKYSRVRFVRQTSDASNMAKQVAPFLRRQQADAPTQVQRAATRKAALAWLVTLADRRHGSLFDLKPAESALRSVTNDADSAESAVFCLGAIATPSAQVYLMELATANVRPVPVRERALAQLTGHIQRFGVMLTEQRVLELRQAAAQETDATLKVAFAATLGSLHPDLRQASQRLKAAPLRRPGT